MLLVGVVTAESFPAIGFKISQSNVVIQVLCHIGITQGVDAERVPDGGGEFTTTVTLDVASAVPAL